ncbi:hypothetical protein GCM10008090_04880 [Arenicella chitinivorans]|uniref:Uncharacterized protein n=2 Tax=Arenicella chitinivorans TaxID=1329800 RepID=A0A918VHJ5_9GAMM|nr:hypothetical protein GCM10008090_04880 [Arenicella chitinivorans]
MNSYLPSQFVIAPESVSYVLISCLGLVSLGAYVNGQVNLRLLLSVRRLLQQRGPDLLLSDKKLDNRKYAMDQLPRGYDAATKLIQITLFFSLMVVALFYISPLLGGLVISTIPLLTVYLVLRQRKHVFLSKEAQAARKNLGRLSDEEYLEPIRKQNYQFAKERQNGLVSDMLSGFMMVAIFFLYLMYRPDGATISIGGIVLVFCMRFSLVYARECSVTLGRLLSQRATMPELDGVDLSPLKLSGNEEGCVSN